jgi:hypothetical protein
MGHSLGEWRNSDRLLLHFSAINLSANLFCKEWKGRKIDGRKMQDIALLILP